MSSEKIQSILARLYTDPTSLKEFSGNRIAFCERNGILSKEEQEFFNALSVDQLSFFSNSLVSKRFYEVKALLPVFSKLSNKNLKAQFDRFAENSVPSGIHKHHEDAEKFALFILPETRDKLLRAVLKYELLRIRNYLHPKDLGISFHRYNFPKVYAELLAGQNLSTDQKLTIVLWKRGRVILAV